MKSPSVPEAGVCRIVLADDHALVRDGLRQLLAGIADLDVVGEAATGEELLKILKKIEWDVVLCDLSMPEGGGLEVIKQIDLIWPTARVVVLTMHKNLRLFKLATEMQVVKGYVLKDEAFDHLEQAIRKVWRGEEALSPQVQEICLEDYRNLRENYRTLEALTRREREVLRLVAQGLSNKEIARSLFISVRTVESHRANLMLKLRLKSTVELVKFALENGL